MFAPQYMTDRLWSKAGLLNKSLHLVVALAEAEFVKIRRYELGDILLYRLSDLDVRLTYLRGWFVLVWLKRD